MMREGWKNKQFCEIANIVMGQSPKGETTNREKVGTPLLNGPTEFTFVNPIPVQFTTSPKRLAVKNDLLFCVRGSTTGRMNFADQEYAIGRGIAGLRGINGYPTKYVKYVIDFHLNHLLNITTGSTFPNISKGDLEKFEIITCNSKEATQIASILSTIDDKIELNLQMNQTLEDMAMALYKHWFVDFGPFQDGEFVASELGDIPKGWEVKKLGEAIDLNPKIKLPKGTIASFVDMKALPQNSMSVSKVIKKEYKGGAKYENNDTLFARITPCLENGKTAFVDFLKDKEFAFGSTEFLVMRSKKGTSPFWIYCKSRDPFFRKFAISTMVGSSGRQRVQNDPFLDHEFVCPTKDVFDGFSKAVQPWFEKIKNNTQENQTLTTLRNTLLPKLISGEVRVKDIEKTIANAL